MRAPRTTFLALAAAVILSVGCGSKVPLTTNVPVETRSPTDASQSGAGANGGAGANAGATSQSQVAPVDLTKDDLAGKSDLPRIVYFDFDSFVVKDEFKPTVEAHAKALSADRKKKLAIEGHTDERGGREYNLALGQKRAESVLKSLTLLGAQPNQLEAVSFGEERPATQGSDEAAWAKNRRAELVYR